MFLNVSSTKVGEWPLKIIVLGQEGYLLYNCLPVSVFIITRDEVI